ncbi:hypothetical protein TNCV_3020191 [Trichonephila clavipes]|nr:hypothetical protein TNCV_3020191 [Trichonephila clavipes]
MQNREKLSVVEEKCRDLHAWEALCKTEESDPVTNETDEDEDNNESKKGPSNADVLSALETAMEWYEQQSECCPIQLLLLKRIKDLPTKERR